MRKVLIIIQREFIQRVKKKTFLLTTILVPLLMGSGMFLLAKLTTTPKEKIRIAVHDESGLFNQKIKDSESVIFKFIDPKNISKDSLKERYRDLNYDGVLCIPKFDGDRQLNICYISHTTLGMKSQFFINQELTAAYRHILLSDVGFDSEFMNRLDRKIEVSLIVDGKKSDGVVAVASALGYIIGFVMYFFLMIYGTIVMRGVMEEKTNRVVEIMISIVKPFQLMLGKIIGIGLVGFFQFLIWFFLLWIASLGIGLIIGDKLTTLQSSVDVASMNSEGVVLEIMKSLKQLNFIKIGLCLLIYFFFGYVLYASQYAAIGAASNEDSDLQTLALPITLPIIISFVMMLTAVDEPYSNMSVILSYIPFTSPIIMMARLPFDIGMGQILVSMSILIASSVFMVWLSARVYRTGILIQGKKVTVKEVLTWFLFKS